MISDRLDSIIRWALFEEAKKTDIPPEKRLNMLISILTEFLKENLN